MTTSISNQTPMTKMKMNRPTVKLVSIKPYTGKVITLARCGWNGESAYSLWLGAGTKPTIISASDLMLALADLEESEGQDD
jgi:hypothetical protein